MILISSAFAYSPQFVDADEQTILLWKKKNIQISISNSLFDKSANIKNKQDILQSVRNSLKSWEKVANINFDLSYTDKDNVSQRGTKGDGVSLITIAPTTSNLLLFEDKINEASAITRLFYNSKGEIKEADIVLNPILLFSSDGTFGSFDLEATLTHEIGHLLGFGHSQIIGSTMHSHQGKNGVYNLPGFNARTLSQDDIVGAIALYGEKKENSKCCGQIVGELNLTNTKIKRKLNVWVEDYFNGRVIAGITSNKNGRFVLQGLPLSKYNIYAQDEAGRSATINLGNVDLRKVRSIELNKKIKFLEKEFDVNYLGFNGQLSRLAVPLIKGNTYTIYVGGKSLDPQELEILFHTKKIKVIENSFLEHNYNKDISVFSFEIQVSESIESGEYSFYLRDKQGRSDLHIGGITLENTLNR